MWIAMGAMLMFFSALASAFIVRRGLAPAGVEPVLELPNRLLALDTGVLLAGSAALELSNKELRAGARAAFRRWWYIASLLGLLFLAGQLFAWREMARAGFYLASTPDAGFFYMLTAAHALHLVGGVIALVVIAARVSKHRSSIDATRAAAIYWHFLAIVWCCIWTLFAISG